ncbi:MAG: FAD-dependent oxidoreductase [Syntrophomonadaceae bacterium]|nr:FAD-dependent oxidoreductase [Syntrophomonadaceae bacterium]
MSKDNCKVAVIGGGIAGLIIADGLQKKGYKNITLFEKDDRLGGKLLTIFYKGKAYELGALFALPSHLQLRALLKANKIKCDGPKMARVNFDALGNRIIQIPKEDLADFAAEIKRLPEALADYKSLENVDIAGTEAQLLLPFAKWCDIKGFKALKKVYAHYFTSFGLGYLEEMPALYVLRVINLDNLLSFLSFPEFITLKRGFSALIEALSQEIRDIRLSQMVRKIAGAKNEKVCIYTDFEALLFDRLIITAPLDQFAGFYDTDSEMQQFLRSIKYQCFNVYAFLAEKIPSACGCVPENLSAAKRGHLVIWNSRWGFSGEEELVMVYAYHNPENSAAAALNIIEEDLRKLGFKKARLYQFKGWQHAPYVETVTLQRGFYEKITAMQGKNQVYLAGEIMSTISMDNCIRYGNYLINKYF